MGEMSFKKVIKGLGKIGAKTLSVGLSTQVPPFGAMAAKVLADALNLDPEDANFSQQIEAATTTEEGRLAILQAEQAYNLEVKKNCTAEQIAFLDAEVRRLGVVNQSYQAELGHAERTGKEGIAWVRPNIVKGVFKLGQVMIGALIIGAVLDWGVGTWMLDTCLDLVLDETGDIYKQCVSGIEGRTKLALTLSQIYSDNWHFISPIFGVLITWFGGRSVEKALDREH